MATFTSGVYDATQLTTPLLSYTLSGTSNQMVLSADGTIGTVNGANVMGVLYTEQASTAFGPASAITLTSPDGNDTVIRTKLSAGGTIAVINVNNYSVIYTLPAGGEETIAPTSSGADSVGPNIRRLVNLGYV